uniref:Uncharacterized protein n=1 Tax=Lotus japonicus TaxID=34305 RepID=I3SLR7_LOTJA|nr:unknown [Lotus japonicus]
MVSRNLKARITSFHLRSSSTFSRPPRDVTSIKRRYRSSGFPPIVGTLNLVPNDL